MGRRSSMGFLWAISLIGAGVGGALVGASGSAGSRLVQPEMDPDAMMQMMVEFGKPGEHHKILEHMAGNWDCAMSFQMGPGEAVSAKGESSAMVMLDGRFVAQHYSAPDFMGMPFEGHGVVGYDKAKGKYVNAWIDNFGTGIMTMEGTYDKETDTMTWDGMATYPTGPDQTMQVPVRHVIKGVTKDKMVMEFWEPDPATGKMMNNGKIEYTRK